MPETRTSEETNERDREAVVDNFRAQCAATVAGDTDALGDLLDDDFTLTHITRVRATEGRVAAADGPGPVRLPGH